MPCQFCSAFPIRRHARPAVGAFYGSIHQQSGAVISCKAIQTLYAWNAAERFERSSIERLHHLRGFISMQLRKIQPAGIERGADVSYGCVYKHTHVRDVSIFPHHGHNVAAFADVNAARAFWIEVEADQIGAGIYGGKGVVYGFDSADFDFRHKASCKNLKLLTTVP